MAARNQDRYYQILSAIRVDPRCSIRELMERTGITSTSVISYYLKKLEEDGVITRNPYLSRSIELGGPSRRRRGKIIRLDQRKNSSKQKRAKLSKAAARNKGASAFIPKRTKRTDDSQALIDAVVAKAKAEELASAGRDVVQDIRIRLFANGRVHAHKVG